MTPLQRMNIAVSAVCALPGSASGVPAYRPSMSIWCRERWPSRARVVIPNHLCALGEISTIVDMHALADDVAGIVCGEEHDDVRHILQPHQDSGHHGTMS